MPINSVRKKAEFDLNNMSNQNLDNSMKWLHPDTVNRHKVVFAPNTYQPSHEQLLSLPWVGLRIFGVRRTWNCAEQWALSSGVKKQIEIKLQTQTLWQYCLVVKALYCGFPLSVHRKTVILLIGFGWNEECNLTHIIWILVDGLATVWSSLRGNTHFILMQLKSWELVWYWPVKAGIKSVRVIVE